MNEYAKLLIGICVLLAGIPLGNFLAKLTKEELKSGQVYFKLIIFFSLVISVIGLAINNDFILFGFMFIAIVTSRSIIKSGIKQSNY